MNQTLAIFLDAYRELNAKKLFWVTLVLTLVFVAVFALLGVNAKGLSFVGLTIPIPSPVFWYKWAFSFFLIGIWAKWAALILALVSTASIFPDLIAGGSVDLYLSKPIGRLRLFLTKYATGLLFALLQVTVFTVASFIVFGLRAHDWRPSLFLAIPLVLLLYSYLFCFCALMGVMTRSAIAALLLTILFWFICFGINGAEATLFSFKNAFAAQARAADRQVRRADQEMNELNASHSLTKIFGFRSQRIRERRERALDQYESAKKAADKLTLFHRIAFVVATVVPKTGETVDLLDRKLFNDNDLKAARESSSGSGGMFAPPPEPVDVSQPPTTGPAVDPAEALAREQEDQRDRQERMEVMREAAEGADRAARSRSIPWIIGTSLGFEAVLIAWAAWIFWRRDY